MKKYLLKGSLITLALFSFNTVVSAATLSASDNWTFNSTVKQIRDRNIDDAETTGRTNIQKLSIDGTAAFCIDYGTVVQQGEMTLLSETLEQYLARGVPSDATGGYTAAGLSATVNRYLYFGYNYPGRNTDKYYLATQKLIWEAINGPSDPNCATYPNSFYQSAYYRNAKNNPAQFYCHVDFKNANTGQLIDLDAEIAAINASITQYNKTPSFCGETPRIKVGETVNLTDSNNVFGADYTENVICNATEGVTCTRNLNTLSIKATKVVTNKTLTISKTEKGTQAKVYQPTDTQKQGAIVGGYVPGKSCTITVTTYEETEPDEPSTEPEPDIPSIEKPSQPSEPSKNVEKNPQTGVATVVIAWIIGFSALGYATYYFIKEGRKNNN